MSVGWAAACKENIFSFNSQNWRKGKAAFENCGFELSESVQCNEAASTSTGRFSFWNRKSCDRWFQWKFNDEIIDGINLHNDARESDYISLQFNSDVISVRGCCWMRSRHDWLLPKTRRITFGAADGSRSFEPRGRVEIKMSACCHHQLNLHSKWWIGSELQR